jgi:gluconolactonase
MLATPDNIKTLGSGLDHPECICLGPDGFIYAGGEAGQIYRLSLDGKSQQQIASTGGFVLGVTADAEGRIYACDIGKSALFCIDSDGKINPRSSGTSDRPMKVPNFSVFDRDGNLYVSDSGDYWDRTGTGCVFVVRPNGETQLFHAGPFRFANGLAISPDHSWLYIVQSTASNIVRVPLQRDNGPVEITHLLPPHTVPDGITFSEDGRLLIACYRPDVIYVGHPDGRVELFIEDLTAELLMRPTNVLLANDHLYIANLGGWHVAVMQTTLQPAPIYRPKLP